MDVFKSFGGDGDITKESRSRQLQKDIEMLEEIIGDDIDYAELTAMAEQSPNALVALIQKVFEFLRNLARVPMQNEDGTIQYVNVYRRAYETLQYKFKNEDGSHPKWIDTIG